jgi:hypothetical protein
MVSNKIENNVGVYKNDVYLNSVVKFQMKEVEQINKWEDIFANDSKFCFEEKV